MSIITKSDPATWAMRDATRRACQVIDLFAKDGNVIGKMSDGSTSYTFPMYIGGARHAEPEAVTVRVCQTNTGLWLDVMDSDQFIQEARRIYWTCDVNRELEEMLSALRH